MALRKKLMRCSGTGKLMRDVVTKKLMRYNPIGVNCQYCNAGETPANIRVTFAGLTGCIPGSGACLYGGGGSEDYWKILSGWSASLCGTSRILPQTASCTWSKTFTVSWPHAERYNTDCASLLKSYSIVSLTITVVKTSATNVTIRATMSSEMPAWQGPEAFFSGSTANITDCVKVTNVANTIIACDGPASGPYSIDGTVSIVEIE